MRAGRLLVAFALAGSVLAGCASTPVTGPSSFGSSAAESASAADQGGSKLLVTVPGLGASASDVPGSSGLAVETVTSISSPTSINSPTSVGAAAPPAVTSATPPAAPSTVAVQLVGCQDCAVLATNSNVVGAVSAALISTEGRAALLSVNAAGAVLGVLNVPYGVTFPAPAGGELACGAGGRCIVVAAQSDGHPILSAFQLAADGGWRDLSGNTGFVSGTAKGQAVAIEDALGVAIQVTDGSTTVWTVLAWDGSRFSSLGCAPDADSPDLAALNPAACLS